MMGRHLAASTRLCTNSRVKKYLSFCETFKRSFPPFPCDQRKVCLYITWLAKSMRYTSIRSYLSSLNLHLKSSGEQPIDYSNYDIIRCLAGARRTLGDTPHQARPLLPDQLSAMLALLSDAPGHTSFKAAILTSFRGLLRKAHITRSESSLLRSDFTFHPWGMTVRVRKSKSIQFAERTLDIPISRVSHPLLCAVREVERHFKQLPAAPQDQAFRTPSPKGSSPLEYINYSAVLKSLCARVGLDPRDFSSHSLRRGGATYLLMTGSSIQEIKTRGDWVSDCVYLYLKVPLQERVTDDLRVAALLSSVVAVAPPPHRCKDKAELQISPM